VVCTAFALRDAEGKFLTADMIDAFVVGAKYAIASARPRRPSASSSASSR
jgi:hypothetical protein